MTIRVSTAGSDRIVSRQSSVPEVEMRKATPHSIELSDKKDESVTPKHEVGACEVAFPYYA